MNAQFSEKFKVDPVGISYKQASTSGGENCTAMVSRFFSMAGYDKAAVVVVTGKQVSTVAQPWRIHVVAAESDTVSVTTASTPLTGSSITMGCSTIGTYRGVQEFGIRVSATAAMATTPITITINAHTIISGTAADGTAKTFLGSTTVTDGKAIGLSLATVIRDRCTEIDTTWSTVMATAAEGINIYCAVRDKGAGYGGCVAATVITTAAIASIAEQNELYCYPRKAQGIIEFSAADLVSTNSSAKGFRVVIECTATAGSDTPIAAFVVREPSAYSPGNISQAKSTLHAT